MKLFLKYSSSKSVVDSVGPLTVGLEGDDWEAEMEGSADESSEGIGYG